MSWEKAKLAVDFAPERLDAAFVVCYRNADTTVATHFQVFDTIQGRWCQCRWRIFVPTRQW